MGVPRPRSRFPEQIKLIALTKFSIDFHIRKIERRNCSSLACTRDPDERRRYINTNRLITDVFFKSDGGNVLILFAFIDIEVLLILMHRLELIL